MKGAHNAYVTKILMSQKDVNAKVATEDNDQHVDPMARLLRRPQSDEEEWMERHGKILGVSMFTLPVVGKRAGKVAFEIQKQYRRIMRSKGKH